jgi:hypothetical protein
LHFIELLKIFGQILAIFTIVIPQAAILSRISVRVFKEGLNSFSKSIRSYKVCRPSLVLEASFDLFTVRK